VTEKRDRFLAEHVAVSRRFFLGAGAAGAAALGASPLLGPLWAAEAVGDAQLADAQLADAQLADAIAKLESFLTLPDDFRDVSRGKPVPHSLPEEKLAEVGQTRDTWQLEVTSDPENPTKLRAPLSRAEGTALDFAGLMKLAAKHAVRFPKVMTCLNIGCPLGMGIWEGVPLREVLWLTQPREDLRRVFYYGFHNDDEKQMFRSSLPASRIFEDPFDLPPIVLCYKLNGQWLTPERGGPVRVVVPEGYGFKSIKWLSHVVLSNLYHANDTYASGNNDVDSPLKSFAATLSFPGSVKAGEPIPVTGYAQVGISGLTKVQVWIERDGTEWPAEDKYFATAPWRDAEILPPPENGKWGGGLPDDKIPAGTMHFDEQGRPKTWPLRLGKVHWAALLPGLPAGDYTLRSRTVDDKGIGQPMPRPFRKSGHSAIEEKSIRVKG
jgi:DMSO/TMAO reductase YedYZ molybdopterin-dependent catalytic subunit